ncbi:MAG: hypothetical protein OHK0029_05040 [Armatimonadaceae bacterium]
MMQPWTPTDAEKQQYETDGYILLRGVIPREAAVELRGVIKNHILTPDLSVQQQEIDPMDPMGDSPDARAARLRKLASFCVQSPLIWHTVHGSEAVMRVARYFLGDNILCKYNSCFLKPARTGSETPWHQDNGLWRDGETEPFNFWMALDPATQENGCMQFIPGSHKTEIVDHVLYPDSRVHAELPRERVAELVSERGVHHIELEPGDMVCWHSSLWHYSPPNTSEKGRIGIAGVYSTPEIAERRSFALTYFWALKNGETLSQFPPEKITLGNPEGKVPPYRTVVNDEIK